VKVRDWTSELSQEVRNLRDALLSAENPGTKWEREAATATSALPVCSDVGGTLLIDEAGEIVHFDDERRVIEPVGDRIWANVALVSASHRFPSLSALHPKRPEAARDCSACQGTGTRGAILCGVCGGTGWLEVTSATITED
jgi:hypothetical protein